MITEVISNWELGAILQFWTSKADFPHDKLAATAREDVPRLIAEIRRLQTILDVYIKEVIDAGELHLADEQSVRNLEAELALVLR